MAVINLPSHVNFVKKWTQQQLGAVIDRQVHLRINLSTKFSQINRVKYTVTVRYTISCTKAV